MLHACHFPLYNVHPYRKGSIVAEVQNFFGISSNATTDSVKKQINNIANVSFNGTYKLRIFTPRFAFTVSFFRQHKEASNLKSTCFLNSQKSRCVTLVSVMKPPHLVMVMVLQCVPAVRGTSSQNSQLNPAFVSVFNDSFFLVFFSLYCTDNQ